MKLTKGINIKILTSIKIKIGCTVDISFVHSFNAKHHTDIIINDHYNRMLKKYHCNTKYSLSTALSPPTNPGSVSLTALMQSSPKRNVYSRSGHICLYTLTVALAFWAKL